MSESSDHVGYLPPKKEGKRVALKPWASGPPYYCAPHVCACVLCWFSKPILGNRYSPGCHRYVFLNSQTEISHCVVLPSSSHNELIFFCEGSSQRSTHKQINVQKRQVTSAGHIKRKQDKTKENKSKHAANVF